MGPGRSYQVQSSRRSAPPKRIASGICWGLALVILGLTQEPVVAQETGTIEGEVLNARTGQPLGTVQISVVGTALGTLSGADGSYRLADVPAGTHQIQAQRLGFGAATQEVEVPEGGTVQAAFELAEEALGLDEIVVSGMAAQAARREVGHSIGGLNLERDVLQSPSSMDNLLQGRAPGVHVSPSSGQVGDGAKIRLRGNVSAALGNEPLIYIDGIRVHSDHYPNLAPTTLGQQYSTFVSPSPLNDINPSDIERIEIVKGAAATTLYGTEAASGVIQIFTKRGVSGDPQWEASLEQGLVRRNQYGVRETLRGTPTGEFAQATSPAGGHVDYWFHDPWMQTGHQQKYTMSVRGSNEPIDYFLSGSYEDRDDIFQTAGQEAYSIRANVGVNVREWLDVDVNSAFNSREIQNVSCGNNVHGICLQVARGAQNYIASDAWEDLNEFMNRDDVTEISRLVTGVTLQARPHDRITSRVNLGYDRSDLTGRIVVPFDHIMVPEGYASVTKNLEEMFTLDVVSTYAHDFSNDVGADVSVGYQQITRDRERVEGWTERFPGPGEVTLSSGAVSLAREERSRVITGGVFGQGVLKYKNRYFLTLGLRVDGSSAFGADFGWEPYPKVSASYIISDEDFWPASLGQTQLRAAWGMAGRAPGAFDAVRTWTAMPWGGETSFIPRNVGNPELGPESTQEIELGFETSALQDRVTVDFTYYHQTTTDALVPVSQMPSRGNWPSQLENIGQIENSGIELGLNTTPLEYPEFRWDLGVDISTNHSEVLDLGNAPEFGAGGGGRIAVGHPVPVIRGNELRNPNEIAEPDVAQHHYFGPNLPTHTISPHTTVELPRGIIVTARGEYQGGHYIRDGASRWALATGASHPACWDAEPLIAQGAIDQLTARERLWCLRENLHSDNFVYPADFFTLRELSVRVPLGFAVPGATTASLTLTGTNLIGWLNDEFVAYHPESAGGFSVGQSFTNDIWESPSPPSQFTAVVNVRF